MMGDVTALPGAEQAPPVKANRFHDLYMQILVAWDVFNARLLLGLALLGAIGMWSFEVFRPDMDRLFGVIGYSVLVVIPMIFLAVRKG